MWKFVRRKICRWHPRASIWTLVLSCVAVIFLYEYFQDIFSIVEFEVDKCPACYGTTLCPDVFAGQFELTGGSRWKLLQVFNPKKVFYATYRGRAVVIKKLAHNRERYEFDRALCSKAFHVEDGNCDAGIAMLHMAEDKGLQNLQLLSLTNEIDILRCPSARLFDSISRLKSTNRSSGVAYLITSLQLNAEPITLQLFKYEDGWPFPKYLGACGRAVIEEYVGPTLYDERASFWKQRLKYAYQLALLANKLTINAEEFALYLTDATYDNFAVTSKGEVILVDAESIVIVDRKRQKNTNSSGSSMESRHANHLDLETGHLAFSPSDLCLHNLADHNYLVVCQGLLSRSPWSPGIDGGLLHGLPHSFDRKWNLSNLINECSKPNSYYGRFEVFPKLMQALSLAGIDCLDNKYPASLNMLLAN